MKKRNFLMTMMALVFSFTLVACTSQVNKKDLADKIVKHANEIKSVDAKLNMNMDLEADSMSAKVAMDIDASMINDPLAMKMNIRISLPGSSEQEVQAYVKDNLTYAKIPATDQWIKINSQEQLSKLKEQSNAVMNKEILELIQKKSDKVTLEEKSGKYMITLKNSDDELNEMLTQQMDATGSSATIDKVAFKDLVLTYTFDKNTLDPEKFELSGQANTEKDNIKTKMKIHVNGTYKNVNKVTSIELPAEAKNAQEVSAP